MKTARDLILQIIDRVPALRGTYDEHMSCNSELLPHVFMPEVAVYALDQGGVPESQASLIRLMGCLEEGLRTDIEEIENVIGVGFVETFIGETERLARLWPWMGPLLKKEILALCGSDWMRPAPPSPPVSP